MTTKTLHIKTTDTDTGNKGGNKRKSTTSPKPSITTGKSSPSIVDALLKDRKSSSSPSGGLNSKKLVLDLNSDSYILTDSKSATQAKVDAEHKAMPIKRMSSPVIDPIILAADEITSKKARDKRNASPTPTESRDKLDIFANIDSVINTRKAASPAPVKTLSIDLESSLPSTDIYTPTEPVIAHTDPVEHEKPAASPAEIQAKLAAAKDAIAKINDKIKRKGPSEKYTKLLEQLNGKVKKYTKQLSTPSPIPKIAPPTYSESIKKSTPAVVNKVSIGSSPTPTPSHNTNHIPIVKKESSREISAIDAELANARNLLTKHTTSTPASDTQTSARKSPITTASAESTNTKKRAETIFGIGTSIDTLKDKQAHLHEKHRKLQEQYEHKLKQIEKMKSQKAEIQKLHALEAERRKIYEMEQKLKSLEREQWKEQQQLRKELYNLDVTNHKTIAKVTDRGELFSLKQELSSAGGGRKSPQSPSALTGNVSKAGGGIMSYLANKWSEFTKIPMGEVVLPPKPHVAKANDEVVLPPKLHVAKANDEVVLPPKPHVARQDIPNKPAIIKEADEKAPSPPMKQQADSPPSDPVETKIFGGRFAYLAKLPEQEFDTADMAIAQESHVIPFDDTWLDSEYRESTLAQDCLDGGNENEKDMTYIIENYKTRIVTNLGFTGGCKALDYYMNLNKGSLAVVAMFYALLQFWEANH